MIEKAKQLYFKHREAISYLFFGVLTTAVDFVSYFIFTRLFSINEVLAHVLSQAVAILFAYITNKLFVFEGKTNTLFELIVQFVKFVSCRLVTMVINSAMFAFMIDIMHIPDIISKVVVSIVVIILNYVFSKLIIFRKR